MPFAAYIWLALLIIFGIVEAATAALTSIWFAAGALVATAAALLGGPLWLQILLYLAVSAAALAMTRPLVRRYVDSRKVPTNVGRLMGQTARVTENIDNIAGTGAVYIDGKTWSARSADNVPIEKDTLIRVERIEGVKLIVKKEEVYHAAAR